MFSGCGCCHPCAAVAVWPEVTSSARTMFYILFLTLYIDEGIQGVLEEARERQEDGYEGCLGSALGI
jgi:hypothetical protein